MKRCFAAFAAFATLGFVPSAQASTIYLSNFESGSLPAEHSGGGTVVSSGSFAAGVGLGSYVLQNSDNPATVTTLTLTGLASHTTIDLSLDFLAIDSWDGTTFSPGVFAPDYFNVAVDGTSVFQASVRNVFLSGSSLDSTTVSGALTLTAGGDDSDHIGSSWDDSVWHLTLTGISHTDSTLTLGFFASGGGYQAGSDESLGLDNIRIDADVREVPPSAVPEPASMTLLATGLAGLAYRRRSQSKRSRK